MFEKHSELSSADRGIKSNVGSPQKDSASGRSYESGLVSLDIESLQESLCQSQPATVFKFKPSTVYPKIRLLSSPTTMGVHVTLKAVIRRKSIMIVTDRQGDWWNCTSCGYQGWANITHDMLEKQILIPIEDLRRYEDWRGSCTVFILSWISYEIICRTESAPPS